ncbi:MAG: LTA synthase family protein [Lachnospiraceae bacterium]|nr:LTA synthase family protein [Lachnospiraceae bacterium]
MKNNKEKEEIEEVKESEIETAKEEESKDVDSSEQKEDSEPLRGKKKITYNLKRAWVYSIHTWIFKCFVLAFVLELVLEMLGRRSIVDGFFFMINSPIVFLYNVSIIFFTLLFALFTRKRVFAMSTISIVWLGCGIVNFIVLGYRVTPFAAIDLLMVKDALTMLDVYFTKWQQVLLVIVIILAIVGLVFLFKKTPKFEGARKVKGTMVACVVAWIIVSIFTNFNIKNNIISDDFANLGMAYKDYGFAYCFTNSIVDNGISEPDNYSEEVMDAIQEELDNGVKTEGEVKTPNVIYIQLESFFDPKDLAGLSFSEDPVPTFTRLKEEYPSGYLWVPALGAGTANTEFEVLSGIKSSYFGAGEYPYKTTVNEVPSETICSVFKNHGYGAYAIHNNRGSFYDRINVYDQMGFDAFISLEYMYNVEYTSTGWAKDATLVDDIMKCLEDTEHQDFVYTISVQGHGKYPQGTDTCEDHIQIEYDNAEMLEPMYYYVNQIYEMDLMIADLIDKLDAYGEEYVLVLYGDHLPTLDITDEQLPNSNVFQTEYIIVNNIGLEDEDEDLYSYELSTKVLENLNMPMGYAHEAQVYYQDETVLEEKLCLIAYDMLFGEQYIYDGAIPVPEPHIKRGVSIISLGEVRKEDDHMIIKGENFNTFSKVYEGDDELETIYVDSTTLMVQDFKPESGEEYTVKQVDKSGHILSTTAEYIY